MHPSSVYTPAICHYWITPLGQENTCQYHQPTWLYWESPLHLEVMALMLVSRDCDWDVSAKEQKVQGVQWTFTQDSGKVLSMTCFSPHVCLLWAFPCVTKVLVNFKASFPIKCLVSFIPAPPSWKEIPTTPTAAPWRKESQLGFMGKWMKLSVQWVAE